MNQFKNRHPLRKKEFKKLIEKLTQTFNINVPIETKVEEANFEDFKILIVDNEIDFFVEYSRIFFTLKGIEKYKPLSNKVVVDMGAIKFISNGADVMAPGIIDADKNIKVEDQVWVCDEKYNKPLAVGIALMDGATMVSSNSGKAVKTLHHVGDRLWKICAKSL
jgi:PUA domain protein